MTTTNKMLTRIEELIGKEEFDKATVLVGKLKAIVGDTKEVVRLEGMIAGKAMKTIVPKGHWPKGKNRNPAPPSGFVTRLKRAVKDKGVRATAAVIGCDPRSILRWIAGRNPTAEIAEAVMTNL